MSATRVTALVPEELMKTWLQIIPVEYPQIEFLFVTDIEKVRDIEKGGK